MKKLLLTLLSCILLNSLSAQDTSRAKATYYGGKYIGRKTASGATYKPGLLTAASNKYPIGTKLLVINRKTGQSVIVIVNDRMAKWVKDSRIDLSTYAFKQIAPIAQGIVDVDVVKNKL